MSDLAITPPGNQGSPGSSGSIPCSVIIRGDALEGMDQHMSDDTAIEYGGVLVGTADPLIGLVVVTGYEPLPDADAADTVTFTRETWDHMTRLVMARHPGQRIVGWYHSHPRFGIFLSAHDLAIQTTYFSQPWQVAYVFDPVQHERGFFGWANYDIVRIHEWAIATTVAGIATDLPAHLPAHGPFITSRMLEEEAAAGGAKFVPTAPPDVVMVPLPTPPPPSPAKKRLWAALAVLAIAVGAVLAFALGRNKDDDSSSATTPSALSSAPATDPTSPATTDAAPVESTVTTEPVVETTVPETTTTAETVTTEPVTTEAAPDLPTTPASVTAPSDRVAEGLTPCESTGTNTYTPAANCFVPLNNGNIVTFADGTLSCADPAGVVLAEDATSFTVGIDDDPLALLADGGLVPKCGDVAYAKNVMAGGADALDGLCGSNNTAINDASLRCFSQNPNDGSIAALVAGDGNSIVGTCFTSPDSPTPVALTWTKAGVDAGWRIVSVVYDAEDSEFVASATRDGVPTTATFVCA